MGKFSLFDLLTFILPGGTLIIILLHLNKLSFTANLRWELHLIPFLVAAYITGHLMNRFGLWLEKLIYRKSYPWLKYLQKNTDYGLQINTFCQEHLSLPSFINDEGHMCKDNAEAAYEHIYYFLEVKQCDTKAKNIMAQYTFFRNMTGVGLTLILFTMTLLGLLIIGVTDTQELSRLLFWLTGCLSSLIATIWLMRQRKHLLYKSVYLTFLVYCKQA